MKGNHNSSPFPLRADVPKQKGQGSSVPKSIKKAAAYGGAPGGGGKPSGMKPKY